ncbi:hypothetical protein DFJ73DRAFT_31630 [Zopfochytrium polystomum]|nr:hypothetical protein DFJ73DRAFT_31630 [Zopfochytrium polystomum]
MTSTHEHHHHTTPPPPLPTTAAVNNTSTPQRPELHPAQHSPFLMQSGSSLSSSALAVSVPSSSFMAGGATASSTSPIPVWPSQRPISQDLSHNSVLLSVLANAREGEIVASDGLPDQAHPSRTSRELLRSVGRGRSSSADSAAAVVGPTPPPPEDSVIPSSKRSQSLNLPRRPSNQTPPGSIILFSQSHPKDPLAVSVESENLVLRSQKRLSHPLANADGVFFSEPLVLVTLKLRKRKQSGSSSTSKIGNALSGVFRRSASAGSTLHPSSPKSTGSPRLMDAVEDKLSSVFKRRLSRSGSSTKSNHSLSKPRSTPDLSLQAFEASDAPPSPLPDSLHIPDAPADVFVSPSSPLFVEPVPRTSIGSVDSEAFWSGDSSAASTTTVGQLRLVPPVPALPNIPGSAPSPSAPSAPSAPSSIGSGPVIALSSSPSPSINAPKPRKIGTGFDENEDQLSSHSSHKKVVFKIITPSREVVMHASSPADFKEFRTFVEINRAQILAGGLDNDDGNSIGDEGEFNVAPNEGKRLLKLLKELSESNRYCASCGARGPDWVAYERSYSIPILVCEDCSGLYRGESNYFVRSFMFDVSLFQDTDSDVYKVIQSTVNASSVDQIRQLIDEGKIPRPPQLFDFSAVPKLNPTRSLLTVPQVADSGVLVPESGLASPSGPSGAKKKQKGHGRSSSVSSIGGAFPLQTTSAAVVHQTASLGSSAVVGTSPTSASGATAAASPSSGSKSAARFSRGFGLFRDGANNSAASLTGSVPSAASTHGSPIVVPTSSASSHLTQQQLRRISTPPASSSSQPLSPTLMPPSASSAAAAPAYSASVPSLSEPRVDPSEMVSHFRGTMPTASRALPLSEGEFSDSAAAATARSGGGAPLVPRKSTSMPVSISGAAGPRSAQTGASVALDTLREASFEQPDGAGQHLHFPLQQHHHHHATVAAAVTSNDVADLHVLRAGTPASMVSSSSTASGLTAGESRNKGSSGGGFLSKQAAMASVEAGTKSMKRFLTRMTESRLGSRDSSEGKGRRKE